MSSFAGAESEINSTIRHEEKKGGGGTISHCNVVTQSFVMAERKEREMWILRNKKKWI